MNTNTRIRVRIDRLVIDGLPVDPRHGSAIRAAVETELSRLLSERDGGRSLAMGLGGEADRLSGGSIVIDPAVTPDRLGEQVGGAIHRSLDR